ncbi:TRAP transporter substrate-binding protein [Chthonobacter albigriseus]|uniref:TRAP transporter substrate-binding protein n=1 Tax=Chthonobacter albigriseus TaxID=1683161 RepID=UPI0015EF9AB5|nr:TRAP transporter substrate-binding protein [Chthonobacter albigriseus]
MFRFKTFTAAIAVAAALAGSPALAADITLRSADIHPDGYPTVDAVKFMGDLVKERTGGRIEIQVFNNRQLGEEKDTIEQTRFGVIDMNRINLAPLNNLVPQTVVPALPFIFRSTDHMHKVMDGPIGEQILAALEPHGLIGLAFYDSGARSFYTVNKQIKSIEDVKGMKIRVQQSDMWLATMEALGANPTPMSMGEVYSSLETGVIDGAENNWPSYESSKHYEIAKFYTLSQHSMSPEVLVVSKISWDKLSPEDQAILKAAAKESVPKMRELWQAREAKSEAVVREAGSTVAEIDKQPFIDAMKPVYERFANTPELQDLVQKIQATE